MFTALEPLLAADSQQQLCQQLDAAFGGSGPKNDSSSSGGDGGKQGPVYRPAHGACPLTGASHATVAWPAFAHALLNLGP